MDQNVTGEGGGNPEVLICGFTEECDFRRFFFITALSLIACGGVFSNGLLAWVFTKHQCPSTPPTLYPTFLAILDGLICCFYIFLFGFDVIMIYLRIEVRHSFLDAKFRKAGKLSQRQSQFPAFEIFVVGLQKACAFDFVLIFRTFLVAFCYLSHLHRSCICILQNYSTCNSIPPYFCYT